ncbi:MAG: glutamate-cysteine ligase family protein [Gemmatimonadota bacterium]|nr:glutamate-cysteine ligase family protein [Gemmatimonadota bacterium]MDH5758997.1 glutamate-cysteine ligase family protein [Gemmatimonadota bacterium]
MTDPGKPTTVLPASRRPGLFEAFGVEIEMMIVDADTLDVLPACDALMEAVTGTPTSEAEFGPIAWSNELVLHVLEMKTNGPAPTLSGLHGAFHESVRHADEALYALGARLMPGGAHPWMDPARETTLWPHEYTEVYHTFDRIFGCAGHGWSNLQSTHLNLPFADDGEFARLHAAIRLVIPLIPALAASSPFLDGRHEGILDRRLDAYRRNAARVPSVTGKVVPESVRSEEEYRENVLGRIYRDLAPHDPEGVLRHEWANARGAIARFDRGAIEIRVVDAQECPRADLAVVAAITSVVRALASGPAAERDVESDPSTEALAALLEETIRSGERAPVEDETLLGVLGYGGSASLSAGDVWKDLLHRFPPDDPDREWTDALDAILGQGPLARRILRATGTRPDRDRLRATYRDVTRCLSDNVLYTGG